MGEVEILTTNISPVGGPGAPPIFFGGRPPGALLKFQTWCTPGYGEGEGNFSIEIYPNFRAKLGAVRPDIFLTPREFLSAGIFTRVTLVFLTGV